MKKIIACFIFYFLCEECFSQAGEWVWLKGDSIHNQPGNFGVQGVPSPTNCPPSLYEPCEWTDLNGNFWLFAGQASNNDRYTDLWRYDPVSNEWTWMKGFGIVNPPVVFGTQGVSSPLNNPVGTLWGQPSFTDLQGNLWMMDWYINLWKYDISINEWTWMKGPGAVYQQGIYGIQGIPDTANHPGNRFECTSSWTDNIGDLWLFGGQDGFSATGWDAFNDLWRYSISANTWTWMKGDSTVNGIGNYGTIGIENAGNNPPARFAYSHWKDTAGNLWFFGGGHPALPHWNYFNDMWRYNPTTNNWTWMGGDSIASVSGSYGIKCMQDSLNVPCSRFENRAVATDPDGNFLMFGGAGNYSSSFSFGNLRNDLWKYCPSVNQWLWIGGDSISYSPGNWGSIGVSSPFNSPKSRGGAVAWADGNYHFYVFGGLWGGSDIYNDLWKFTIDTTCGVCLTSTGIKENNLINELLVFPNPANSSFTVSFSSAGRQPVELRIYNTLGKRVYFSEEESAAGKFEKEINVEKWSSGIYFLSVWISSERAKTGGRILSRKIAVSR